ncbi:MAG: hypothetical protein ACM3PX_12435 [Omnitrophica WOR_2 bacterium]
MNNDVRKFLRSLLLVAAITGLLIIATILLIPSVYVSPALPYLLLFHTAVTLISFLIIEKKLRQSPQKFVTYYLANTTVKLILFLVILMVYSLNFLSDAVNFIISFFILYLIFTILEVIQLVKVNRGITGKTRI